MKPSTLGNFITPEHAVSFPRNTAADHHILPPSKLHQKQPCSLQALCGLGPDSKRATLGSTEKQSLTIISFSHWAWAKNVDLQLQGRDKLLHYPPLAALWRCLLFPRICICLSHTQLCFYSKFSCVSVSRFSEALKVSNPVITNNPSIMIKTVQKNTGEISIV